MDAQWKTRLFKIILWVVTEATLNLLNLDTIANFGEFVLGHEFAIANENQPAITTLADKNRSFISCVGFPSLES